MFDRVLVFSDVFGVALGDVEAAPVAPHAVSFSSSGAPGLIAREPTEARLTGHADGMVVQREQVPGPGWQLPSAGYRELMGLLLRSNPSSQIFGGHYSRLGMPWKTQFRQHLSRKAFVMTWLWASPDRSCSRCR